MDRKLVVCAAMLVFACMLAQGVIFHAKSETRDNSSNDTFANAELLPLDSNGKGFVLGAVTGANIFGQYYEGLPPGDDTEDIYKITTELDKTYLIKLTFDVGDVDIFIFNSSASATGTSPWYNAIMTDSYIGESASADNPEVYILSSSDTTHYIVVSAYENKTSNYNLSVEKVTPPPPDGNDDKDSAVVISQGTITGDCSSFDVHDWYKIYLTTSQNSFDKLTISFSITMNVNKFVISIYDPNSFLLTDGICNSTSSPASIQVVCGLTGYYYIDVGFSNNNMLIPVDYSLTATVSSVNQLQAPEHDSNNDFGNATILQTTSSHTDQLNSVNDPHDFLRIDLTGTPSNPQYISAELVTTFVLNYISANEIQNLVIVTLYNAEKKVITSDGNFRIVNNIPVPKQTMYLNYTSEKTETVYARVWVYNGDTGGYTASLTSEIIVPDNNNDPLNATMINPGIITGEVCKDMMDSQDWYKIFLNSGEVSADLITLTLTLQNPSQKAWLYLKDPVGWNVVNDGTEGGMVTLERPACTEGYYYICVASVSLGKIQYTLNVSVRSTQYVDDHNNEFENATPVYQTTNFTSVTVGPADLLDYYVYHAEQSDNISLKLSALECDYDLYIVTKCTSGYPLFSVQASSNISDPSKTVESINYTVPTAGDYYFVVKYYSHQVPNKPYKLEVYVPTHNLPPTITSFQPSNTVVDMLPGQTQTFSVTATDTSPLTYKWYVGGIEQVGENTNSFNYVAGEFPTTVKCVVRDDTTGVSSVTWTIRIDPKPTLRTSTPSQNEVTIPADAQVVFSVEAEDTNQLGEVTTASLTYNWSVCQSGDVVQYLGTSTSVVINHTTSSLIKGIYVLSVKITDTAGQCTYRNWTITIPNHLPKYTGSTTATCNEDSNITLTGIKTQFVDADGDSLTITVTGGAGVDAEFIGNDLKITPKENWFGVENITITASDGSGSISVLIKVTVTNVNDAPIPKATMPTISFTEDTSYSIGIDQFFTDPEGSAVMIHSVTADVGQVTVTKNGTNIDIIPAANYFGTFNLTIVATDGTAQSDLIRVPVIVTGVNDAPTVSITNPSNGFKTNTGKKITFDCTASDPDGDTLTYRWLDGNKEISTSQKFEKSLSAGKHTITVSVSDGKLQVSATEVVVNVSEAKSPGFEGILVVLLLGCAAILLITRRRM